MEPLATALWYAASGVPVLPLHTGGGGGRCSCRRPHCDRPGKHPRWHPRLITAGLHQATTDPDQVVRWWTAWPRANVGLRTGVTVDVCDVDTPVGLRLLSALVDDAAVPAVRTGSGGLHLYFAATGAPNRVRVLPGVDWRGKDGYVVAPPSIHANGRRYRWIRHGPAPDCPSELISLVMPPPRPHPRSCATRPGTPRPHSTTRRSGSGRRRWGSATTRSTGRRAAWAGWPPPGTSVSTRSPTRSPTPPAPPASGRTRQRARSARA
ncbi:bifunctional DNA primase/polymerase [Phytohabitans rumicis]|uniref:bifunctional DNA primase/polymerase n=1 Tax=Phytohabitans rumicis TaxID=1076125 RepID=UPI001FEA551B|nr:bifunctional DNA primase/polymerase [Phytohabitans rumicis]